MYPLSVDRASKHGNRTEAADHGQRPIHFRASGADRLLWDIERAAGCLVVRFAPLPVITDGVERLRMKSTGASSRLVGTRREEFRRIIAVAAVGDGGAV